jgi:hypothetical protein
LDSIKNLIQEDYDINIPLNEFGGYWMTEGESEGYTFFYDEESRTFYNGVKLSYLEKKEEFIPWTPIMLATFLNKEEVVNYLYKEAYADIDYEDDFGNTALGIAIEFNFENLIKLFQDSDLKRKREEEGEGSNKKIKYNEVDEEEDEDAFTDDGEEDNDENEEEEEENDENEEDSSFVLNEEKNE